MSAVLQKNGRKRIAGTGSFAYNGDGLILSRRDGSLDGSVFKQNTAAGQPATGAALGRMNLHNVYANGQQVAGLDEAGKLDVLSRLTAFSSSAAGRAQVVVQAGETLQSLAQRVYGNGGLWYVIAGANGLDSDADLVAGASLTVPEVRTSSNDASTFKPYNPGEITGPTSPGLPYIAPPDAGCNTVAMIIMVAIAIVVTVYTAGAMSGAMAAAQGATAGSAGSTMAVGGAALTGGTVGVTAAGTTLTLSTAGGMVVGATAGAAGTAASLAVGSAMDAASFSWRDVAAGAITGGVTAGVASSGLGTVGAAGNVGDWGKAGGLALATAGAGAVGQIATGRSFSWRSVAASAVSSMIGAGISKTFSVLPENQYLGNGDFIDDFANHMVGGVVSLHTRRAFGFDDRVNYGSVVVDAFGNALGNAVATGIGSQRINRTLQDASLAFGDSFDERHPNATASLDHGDVQFSASHVYVGGEVYERLPDGSLLKSGTAGGDDLARGSEAALEIDIVGGQPIKTLDTVEVTAVREGASRNDWYFYGWNRAASQWVDLQHDTVNPVAWSQPPQQTNAIGAFISELQAYNTGNTPSWQPSPAASLRAPSQAELDYYAQNGRPMNGAAQASDPPGWYAGTMQRMRDSWIGQSAPGRAYLGGVRFATGLPGALMETAQALAPEGQMRMALAVTQTVREQGVLGVIPHTMASMADGLHNGYQQAYFGTEEDRVYAVLNAATVIGGGESLMLGRGALAEVRGARGVANSAGDLAATGINPRLTQRLEAWRAYQTSGGQLDLQGWVQRTQGTPWGTGFKSGYANWANSVESVHGNSLLSKRPAFLYEKFGVDGNFLKWGIAQDLDARTLNYLGNGERGIRLFEYASGSRSEMAKLERFFEETQPGPQNLQPWAVEAWNAGRRRAP